MKRAFWTYCIPLFVAPYLNAGDIEYTDAKDREYSAASDFIFEASVLIEKREYRDRDGFSITEPSDLLKGGFDGRTDQPMSPECPIHYVQYFARFMGVTMIKGEQLYISRSRWSYLNHVSSEDPEFPGKVFLTGKRVRFYAREVKENRVSLVGFLPLPDETED